MSRDDGSGRLALLASDFEWPRPPLAKPASSPPDRPPTGLEHLRAFLRHSPRPLDVILGVSSLAERAAQIQQLRSLAGPSKEARFLPPEEFARELSAGRYAALLDLDRMRPALGAYLRARFAPKPLPYVCLARDGDRTSEWIRTHLLAALPGSRPYDAIVCPSRSLEESLRRILGGIAGSLRASLGESAGFRGRLSTLPPGVDTERFRPRDRHDLRIRLGLPEAAVLAYWRGRFTRETCADLAPLMIAVARARKRNPAVDLRLLLCAEDPEGLSRLLVRLARDLGADLALVVRVVVPDFAEPLLYAASDLYVSVAEGPFEGRIPEAMASGLPVLAVSPNGCPEAVEPGLTGVSIPFVGAAGSDSPASLGLVMDDSELRFRESRRAAVDLRALECRLSELAEDGALRAEMGARARERAEARFAWPKVAALHEDLLRELIAMASEDDRPLDRSWAYPWFGMGSAFADHPSETLSGESRIALSDRGLDVLRGKARVMPDTKAAPLFSGDLMERTLRTAAKLSLRRPARIADLIDRSRDDDPKDIWRYVMWLLKYDLLEIRGSQ